jgi:hypothetical protein
LATSPAATSRERRLVGVVERVRLPGRVLRHQAGSARREASRASSIRSAGGQQTLRKAAKPSCEEVSTARGGFGCPGQAERKRRARHGKQGRFACGAARPSGAGPGGEKRSPKPWRGREAYERRDPIIHDRVARRAQEHRVVVERHAGSPQASNGLHALRDSGRHRNPTRATAGLACTSLAA